MRSVRSHRNPLLFGLVLPGALLSSWLMATHLRWVKDDVSLRAYLLFRCGWIESPEPEHVRGVLRAASSRDDLRLCLAVLDWTSRRGSSESQRSMAAFLAGCCAWEMGREKDAWEIWSRSMVETPFTRAGQWSKRAAERLLSQSGRRWIL